MQCLLIALIFVSSAWSITFSREEIMSLTPKERTELYMKLPESKRRAYADSLRVWAQNYVIMSTAKMAEEYKKKLSDINSLMQNSMMVTEKMAAQVGFNLITTVILLLSSTILGVLMYRKKSRRLFISFVAVNSFIAGFYAFVMLIVF